MGKRKLFHPRPEVLAGYALELLGTQDNAWIWEHVIECESCHSELENLSGTARGIHAPMPAPHPPVIRSSPEKPVTDEPVTALYVRTNLSTNEMGKSLSHGEADIPIRLAEHPRYRIVEVLGVGGMGIVYKAEHRFMERLVALKVIHPNLVDRKGMVARFHREVKAAARLLHPNIVPAFDAEDWDNLHFLVMELVEGRDLEKIAMEVGPLPVPQACDYIRQAAVGLQYAFRQKMLHRDIKPQNLMVTNAGDVKILDFGLACIGNDPDRMMGTDTRHGDVSTDRTEIRAPADTGEGWVLGTPDYVAPEEIYDPASADIRADIYSLGCTLYRLLAGTVPFPDRSMEEKIRAHQEETPEPLKLFRSDVPDSIIRTVEGMMHKSPDRRPQTPLDVAREMLPFAVRGA